MNLRQGTEDLSSHVSSQALGCTELRHKLGSSVEQACLFLLLVCNAKRIIWPVFLLLKNWKQEEIMMKLLYKWQEYLFCTVCMYGQLFFSTSFWAGSQLHSWYKRENWLSPYAPNSFDRGLIMSVFSRKKKVSNIIITLNFADISMGASAHGTPHSKQIHKFPLDTDGLPKIPLVLPTTEWPILFLSIPV